LHVVYRKPRQPSAPQCSDHSLELKGKIGTEVYDHQVRDLGKQLDQISPTSYDSEVDYVLWKHQAANSCRLADVHVLIFTFGIKPSRGIIMCSDIVFEQIATYFRRLAPDGVEATENRILEPLSVHLCRVYEMAHQEPRDEDETMVVRHLAATLGHVLKWETQQFIDLGLLKHSNDITGMKGLAAVCIRLKYCRLLPMQVMSAGKVIDIQSRVEEWDRCLRCGRLTLENDNEHRCKDHEPTRL
jgi:hypothetical protein